MSQLFSAITRTNAQDLPRLFEVWESSVRATHSFLTEPDIQSLIPLVKSELSKFGAIFCLREDDGKVYAFLGVAGSRIEMLFVHADNRGSGAGRLLSEFAIQMLHADSVDVNEQNDLAIGFYRHLGFRQIGRSPLDPAGNSFPILHMALQRNQRIAPTRGRFRFAYFTPQYEETVAFYLEGLDFPVIEMWDRSPDDRGTLFGAASGIIEVLALPRSGRADHLFDKREPQGAFMVVEIDQVDSRYRRIMEKGLAIQQELTDQAWGHRSFCVRDPNGLTLFLYSRQSSVNE
jgi:putative acetyltransferase